jgi:hypothetical protein
MHLPMTQGNKIFEHLGLTFAPWYIYASKIPEIMGVVVFSCE